MDSSFRYSMWYCGFLTELWKVTRYVGNLDIKTTVLRDWWERREHSIKFCDAQECVVIRVSQGSRAWPHYRVMLCVVSSNVQYFQSTELLQLPVNFFFFFLKGGWYCMYFYCTLFVMNLYRHCANTVSLTFFLVWEGMDRFHLCS